MPSIICQRACPHMKLICNLHRSLTTDPQLNANFLPDARRRELLEKKGQKKKKKEKERRKKKRRKKKRKKKKRATGSSRVLRVWCHVTGSCAIMDLAGIKQEVVRCARHGMAGACRKLFVDEKAVVKSEMKLITKSFPFCSLLTPVVPFPYG